MPPLRYTFDVTCPYCATPLVHENGANPGMRLSHAVTLCAPCNKRFHIRVELTLLDSKPVGETWMNRPLATSAP